MPAPSNPASSAAPTRGFDIRGLPPVPFFDGASPSPKPKRRRLSQEAVDKEAPAKGAPPPGTQELSTAASGNEERNTPTASGQDAAPIPDQDTASGQEEPGDAAESASAGPGEPEFVPDWGDPNAPEQIGNRDGLGPDEEDATASGQVRGESHGSTDEIIFPLAEAAPPKSFPGFPRSVVYKIGNCLGTATTGHRLCTTQGSTVAFFLMRAVDFRAKDQKGPGPGPDGSATASGQASRSETMGMSATRQPLSRRFPAFSQNDPRWFLCRDEMQREHLAQHAVPEALWPPFVTDHFQPRLLGSEARRKEYHDSGRGMTPVFTAAGQNTLWSGQGTLWVGDMIAAKDAQTIAGNRIRVRINCLGHDRDDFGRDPSNPDVLDFALHVQDLLRGKGYHGDLWNTLREVDRRLESGESVLLYCKHGEYHSAFVAVCYLRSKCRVKEGGQRYRHASLCGFLRMLRSVIDKHLISLLKLACAWLDFFNGKNNARERPLSLSSSRMATSRNVAASATTLASEWF